MSLGLFLVDRDGDVCLLPGDSTDQSIEPRTRVPESARPKRTLLVGKTCDELSLVASRLDGGCKLNTSEIGGRYGGWAW